MTKCKRFKIVFEGHSAELWHVREKSRLSGKMTDEWILEEGSAESGMLPFFVRGVSARTAQDLIEGNL